MILKQVLFNVIQLALLSVINLYITQAIQYFQLGLTTKIFLCNNGTQKFRNLNFCLLKYFFKSPFLSCQVMHKQTSYILSHTFNLSNVQLFECPFKFQVKFSHCAMLILKYDNQKKNEVQISFRHLILALACRNIR